MAVKEVVGTLAEAEREVERLNALGVDGSKRYAYRTTRYFPAPDD